MQQQVCSPCVEAGREKVGTEAVCRALGKSEHTETTRTCGIIEQVHSAHQPG